MPPAAATHGSLRVPELVCTPACMNLVGSPSHHQCCPGCTTPAAPYRAAACAQVLYKIYEAAELQPFLDAANAEKEAGSSS